MLGITGRLFICLSYSSFPEIPKLTFLKKKKKTKQNKTPNSMLLPWEIIVEILARLPVKSLLRFRCVSKRFYSLIDSKDFIYLNVNRSIETNSNLNLIHSLVMWKPETRIYSLNLDSLDKCVELTLPSRRCRFSVIGSCNGLLALQWTKGIILLNPLTREDCELPKFYDDGLLYDGCYDGFGYDVGSDDYKLVKIIAYSIPVEHTEVTIYSLKNNSSRKIEDFPYHFWRNQGIGAYVNGALHWTAHMNPECVRDDLIIAFDLKSEEFHHLPMPLAVRNEPWLMGVDILGGCLSLVCASDTGILWDVFVMKDYEVQDSWTKLFTLKEEITYPCDYVKALAYSGNRDKVLFVDSNGKLYWYDLEKQRIDSGIEIDVEDIAECDNGIVCVDSLVSLGAYAGNC